jgi:transposase, IS30 family
MQLRQLSKKRRRRYCLRDSARGKPSGRGRIVERPASVEERREPGHFDIDTIKGDSQGTHTAITMVEWVTGCTPMGKLTRYYAAEITARLIEMIGSQGGRVKTATADNGSGSCGSPTSRCHGGVPVYSATAHYSWVLGTDENANGLIRQYLPRQRSIAHVTQDPCDRIATRLNRGSRERLGFRTPQECQAQAGWTRAQASTSALRFQLDAASPRMGRRLTWASASGRADAGVIGVT